MDLTSNYLGLTLANPLIASSSPLNLDLDNIMRLEDSGAAAVVLPSMFEEQLEEEAAEIARLTTAGSHGLAEAVSFFAPTASYRAGPHNYLETIRRAREAVAIPVIASLNGVTDAGWASFAGLIEEAGASAIELNVFYVPADPSLNSRAVEQRHVDVLRAVRRAVDIPIAIKLSPYFSAVGHFIRELDQEGAGGFVLFNRFYEPDIDLTTLELKRDLELSTASEIRLPLLWIAALSGRVRGSLAASTGVETSDQVIKYLLVGADAVMTTSALLRHGIGHMRSLLDGLTQWLEARDIASVQEIRGKMSQRCVRDPTAFERANYIQILRGWWG